MGLAPVILDGVTYEAITATTCKIVSYKGTESTLYIPGKVGEMTVVEIGERVFMGHDELTCIDLPNSIERICAYAFKNCSNLREMRTHN